MTHDDRRDADPLAGAGDPLAAHLDDLGAQLGQGVARAERQRRGRLAAGGLGVAAVSVALGAAVALPGGRELDPVAEAKAAVAQRGGILHFVYTQALIPPNGIRAPRVLAAPPTMEVWTATTGRDRYRYRERGPVRSCNVVLSSTAKGLTVGPPLVSPSENAMDGHVATAYSRYSRVALVRVEPGASVRHSAGAYITPDFGLDDPRDPVRNIQQALSTGKLRDGGTVVVRGRRLRRLVGHAGVTRRLPDERSVVHPGDEHPHRERASKYTVLERPREYTYLVDADTFAPVELRTRSWGSWSRSHGKPNQAWFTSIQRFAAFDVLADTPANRKLLSIDLPAGTKIYRAPRDPAHQIVAGSLGDPAPSAEARAALRRCRAAIGK